MSAPPQKGAESIQVGRYLKYLKSAFNIELITTNTPNHSWVREDRSIATELITNNRLEIKVYRGKFLNKILHIFNRDSPEDRFVNNYENVIKELKQNPDIIYSRALPHSSTLLAKKLKDHFKVPWVIHLSDPWEDNTFINNKNNSSIEHECFNSAAIVTLTSDLAVQFYKKKYPELRNKFVLMPNVFDEETTQRPRFENNNDVLIITHTGNFYGSRNPAIILNVLSQLKQEKKLQNVKLYFAGEMDAFSKQLIETSNLPEIEVLGSINLDESIELQQKSDILLIINKKQETIADLTTLPSKLLDYCSTRKPILAITPKGSSTDSFISNYGVGHSFDNNQVIEIKNHIISLIDDFKNKKGFLSYEPPRKYGAIYNAEKLSNLINLVIENNS